MTRLSSPAALRNRDPILDVLRMHLPPKGLVVEVASGSGEHVVYFAQNLPGLVFQPSDPDAEARASIDSWVAESGLANVRPALDFDVTRRPWPFVNTAAILCINMVHISPWRATEALMAGAARHLAPGGILYLYGPYKRGGAHTAPSNASFDESLRLRNTEWGVRDLETVADLAMGAGFSEPAITPMPANNLSLVFSRLG
ncbi:MAG: DUF938 domain-containing protein [Alphaproteobacteria bacterium]